jgi:hypothetical protein
VREQVPCDRDEIRPSFMHPLRGLPGRADPGRRDAEVEVGKMCDPQTLELSRKAR